MKVRTKGAKRPYFRLPEEKRRRGGLLFVQTVQTKLYLNQGIKAVSIKIFKDQTSMFKGKIE